MTGINSSLLNHWSSTVVKVFMDDLFLMSPSLNKIQEVLHYASLPCPGQKCKSKLSNLGGYRLLVRK